MTNQLIPSLILAAALGAALPAQNPGAAAEAPAAQQPEQAKPAFSDVAKDVVKQNKDTLAELAALRERIGEERLPMAQQLSELEAQLSRKRVEYDEVASTLAEKTQNLSNMNKTLEDLRKQSDYLHGLLTEYLNNFATRLHIVELQRYQQQIDEEKLARENTKLSDEDLFAAQLKLVDTTVDHLQEALGGMRFTGTAVADGAVKGGKFVVIGPTALFMSDDGQDIGTAEEGVGSNEATLVPFTEKEDIEAAAQLALGTGGSFPLDVTLGNAQKVESIKETWWEHVQKGGVIMIPMGIMAGAALLVVLLKWIAMMFVRRPSRRQVDQLVDFVEGSDYASAVECAEAMRGPGGRMLEAGANHLGEPRELVEEVMFEQVLATRLRLQSWLPFVAICATSAPLLGLLGTVTGIMDTFSLMTELGMGDPKVLSSGISKALITTETGLVVAIPSLLLHAFLARKAKGIVDDMEKLAVRFMNHVRSPEPIAAEDVVEVA